MGVPILIEAARGKTLGRRKGAYITSGQLAPKVLAMVEAGRSYRVIAKALKLSKNTMMGSVHRHRKEA
jgi:putative DNA-invertase from lambdoid prophage Rac